MFLLRSSSRPLRAERSHARRLRCRARAQQRRQSKYKMPPPRCGHSPTRTEPVLGRIRSVGKSGRPNDRASFITQGRKENVASNSGRARGRRCDARPAGRSRAGAGQVAGQAGDDHRAVRGRRQHGRHGPHLLRAPVEAARPAVRRREQGRSGRHDRAQCHDEGCSRRLHYRGRNVGRHRHQSGADQGQDSLRRGQGLHLSLRHGGAAEHLAGATRPFPPKPCRS